ncbi:MAG: cell division protein FtsQ/DivIB [Prevotellaceae bacterium]|jgi:cell division protein FtsQ|nr:cell division protein FtsQ/DivIB [Prevotellaceae bacterium]
MKRKTYILLGVIAILGYLVFAVSAFSYKSDKQACNNVVVVIKDSAQLRFISKKEIMLYLAQKELNPIGKNMQTVQTEGIEKLLKRQPRIKNAECYKTPSGTVYIEITQREPILRVMNSGRSYYVDREGEIMPVSSSFAAYVPIVTGAVNEEFAKGPLYDFALYLRRNAFWNAQIEQIHVDYSEEVELIPRVGNQIILLGKLDNYEYKLNKLFSLYKNGFSLTGWNCYRQINLKYDNQVICTKK